MRIHVSMYCNVVSFHRVVLFAVRVVFCPRFVFALYPGRAPLAMFGLVGVRGRCTGGAAGGACEIDATAVGAADC